MAEREWHELSDRYLEAQSSSGFIRADINPEDTPTGRIFLDLGDLLEVYLCVYADVRSAKADLSRRMDLLKQALEDMA